MITRGLAEITRLGDKLNRARNEVDSRRAVLSERIERAEREVEA